MDHRRFRQKKKLRSNFTVCIVRQQRQYPS